MCGPTDVSKVAVTRKGEISTRVSHQLGNLGVRRLFLHRISGIAPGLNPSSKCRCIKITVL